MDEENKQLRNFFFVYNNNEMKPVQKQYDDLIFIEWLITEKSSLYFLFEIDKTIEKFTDLDFYISKRLSKSNRYGD